MTEKNQVAIPTPLPATAQDVANEKLLVEIRDAEILLGFRKKKDYSINELLKSFQVCFEVFDENDEAEKILPLTNAKNSLLRYQLDMMVAKNNGHFDLKGQIPFESVCVSCHGTGELYKFFRNSIPVPCKFCTGKPVKMVPCRNCKGSGKVKKSKEDGYVNDACPACKGKGTFTLKCRKCRDTRIFHKMVLDSIRSTTPCKKCNGRGFDIPKPVKKEYVRVPDNPVISADLGQEIKKVFKT